MKNSRRPSLSKKGSRWQATHLCIRRSTPDTCDEREARQFNREATHREAEALGKYGLAAYDQEDIRRDEHGRILR